jgi:hypothetical protein
MKLSLVRINKRWSVFVLILIAKALCASNVAGIEIPSDVNHFNWYTPLQPGSTIDNSLISEMLRRFPTSDETDLQRTLCGYALKEWPFKKGVYIGMAEVETWKKTKNAPGLFHSDVMYSDVLVIAVRLDDQNSNFSVVAALRDPVRIPARFSSYNFQFDFAPFKLNKSEYAFGIRASLHVCGTGWCETMEWLDLYRIDAAAITRILSTPIGHENSCLRDCNDAKDEMETATISVSAESTNGVYNLIKRCDRKPPAVFKWDGLQYTLNGNDPFESFSESLTEEQ